MLVLRRIGFLKLTKKETYTIHRQLRRLPRQQIEVEVAPPAVSGSIKSLELRDIESATINTHPLDNIQQNKPENRLNDDSVSDDSLPSLPQGEKDYVPTFNLAAYVNKSETLQQLVKLGVDLHSIERRKGLAEFVLRLDFEKNVKDHLLFLQDQGVSPDIYGNWITKNPLIFKEDLDDLQTRINYLEMKKFTQAQRQRILTLNPYWLMFSTQRIDRRLGYFQKEFKLMGNDVRFLASKQPRLITYKMESVRQATFCIREEMGFNAEEIKCLLLSKPRLWMMNSDMLIERFAYAHNEMKLSHDMLLKFPEILISREFRIRQRHEFLKSLGRAQYDPEKDLYISPKAVVEGNDFQFVRNVAKSDMEIYDMFLKTHVSKS